jgi:hypothetical protein
VLTILKSSDATSHLPPAAAESNQIAGQRLTEHRRPFSSPDLGWRLNAVYLALVVTVLRALGQNTAAGYLEPGIPY